MDERGHARTIILDVRNGAGVYSGGQVFLVMRRGARSIGLLATSIPIQGSG